MGWRKWRAHAARSEGIASVTPFRSASRMMAGIRQCGILPAVFQLETVDGGASMAFATSTVPPRATIICSAVIMHYELR